MSEGTGGEGGGREGGREGGKEGGREGRTHQHNARHEGDDHQLRSAKPKNPIQWLPCCFLGIRDPGDEGKGT